MFSSQMREDTKVKINYKSDTSKKFRFVFTTTDDDQLCHQLQYTPAFPNVCNYKNAIVKQNKQTITTIYYLWIGLKNVQKSQKNF